MEIIVTNKLGRNIHLTSEEKLEPARKHPLTWETLREQLDRLGGTIYSLGTLEAEIIGSPMLPLSILGHLRREMIAKLDAFPMGQNTYSVADENALESLRRADAGVP